MSTPETPPSPPPQFSLRHSALAFGVAGVLLAITAPWIRNFNAAQWIAIGQFTLEVILGAVIARLLLLLEQHRAARRSGRVLVDVGRQTHFRFQSMRTYLIAAMLFFLATQLNNQIFELRDNPDARFTSNLGRNSLLPLMLSAFLVFIIGQTGVAKFCERGLLVGTSFFSWQIITNCYWSHMQPNLLLVGCDSTELAALQVSPEQREQVEAILRTHARGFIQSTETSHSKD